MTITHVGPSYTPPKKTATAPQGSSQPSTTSSKPSRSWEAWELSGKTGKWTRIPDKVDQLKAIRSEKSSAPSTSGDTVAINPKSAHPQEAPTYKPAETPTEKKATGAKKHLRSLLSPFKKLTRYSPFKS